MHNKIISKTMAGQIQQVIPKYHDIDPDALAGSLATLVRAMAVVVEEDDSDRFLDIACDIAEMRLAGGFVIGDMVGAGVCFLPVLRRFFMERCRNTNEALGAYSIVEELAMPLVVRFANAFAEMEKIKIPVGASKDMLRSEVRRTMSAGGRSLTPVPVLSTFDFMDDEDTVPDWVPA